MKLTKYYENGFRQYRDNNWCRHSEYSCLPRVARRVPQLNGAFWMRKRAKTAKWRGGTSMDLDLVMMKVDDYKGAPA